MLAPALRIRCLQARRCSLRHGRHGRPARSSQHAACTGAAAVGFSGRAVALTLLDYETPVWLDAALAQSGEVAAGSSFTPERRLRTIRNGGIRLYRRSAKHAAFAAFSQGSMEYPDRAATLVLQVDRLSGDDGLRLSGPASGEVVRCSPRRCPRTSRRAWAPIGRCFHAGSTSFWRPIPGSPRCRARFASPRSRSDVCGRQGRRARHRECPCAAGVGAPRRSSVRSSASTRFPSSSRSPSIA